MRESLRASSHVDETLERCSRSLHALRVLRAHGMPDSVLQTAATATTVARLLYAARHGGLFLRQ